MLPTTLTHRHSAFPAFTFLLLFAVLKSVVAASAYNETVELMKVHGINYNHASVLALALRFWPREQQPHPSASTNAVIALLNVKPHLDEYNQMQVVDTIKHFVVNKHADACHIFDSAWPLVLQWSDSNQAARLFDALAAGSVAPSNCNLDTSLTTLVDNALHSNLLPVVAAMVQNARYDISLPAICAFMPSTPSNSSQLRYLLDKMNEDQLLELEHVPWISDSLRNAIWRILHKKYRVSNTNIRMFEASRYNGMDPGEAVVQIVEDYLKDNGQNLDVIIAINTTINILAAVSHFHAIYTLYLIAISLKSTAFKDYIHDLDYYRPHHVAHMIHIMILQGKWNTVGYLLVNDYHGNFADTVHNLDTGFVIDASLDSYDTVVDSLVKTRSDSNYKIAGLTFGRVVLQGLKTHDSSIPYADLLEIEGFWGMLTKTLDWAYGVFGALFKSLNDLSAVCLTATILHQSSPLQDYPLPAVTAMFAFKVLSPRVDVLSLTLYIANQLSAIDIEQWDALAVELNADAFSRALQRIVGRRRPMALYS